jgi:hypothetical protein
MKNLKQLEASKLVNIALLAISIVFGYLLGSFIQSL